MEERFIATFLLHALGDTIGFNNGIWEFNYGFKETDVRITLEIISEFIKLGGINGINLKNWFVSDDTLLNYEIAKFILNDELSIKQLKINFKNLYEKESKNKKINRYFGITTSEYINKFELNDKVASDYDKSTGGNGAAMRTLPIGLRLNKKDQLDLLINTSIITSKLTHPSPIGFLSGFASAYFVSLAINNVKPELWCKALLDIIESESIRKYILSSYNNPKDYNNVIDYSNFIKIFKHYYEIFYDEKTGKQRELKTKDNIISRTKIFKEIEDFFIKSQQTEINISDPIAAIIGSSGPTAIIMALQALIDSDGLWEKLVYYSMLHGGDSDTVGAIAGGFYGAVYGFGDVPKHLLKHLEFKSELETIAKEIYKKTL